MIQNMTFNHLLHIRCIHLCDRRIHICSHPYSFRSPSIHQLDPFCSPPYNCIKDQILAKLFDQYCNSKLPKPYVVPLWPFSNSNFKCLP